MKRISKFIANHSLLILIISLLLLIPAIIGYKHTKINYDILVYLPKDIETVEGQNILTNDFGIGAFSFVTIDNMSNKEILNLENKIKEIENVNQVVSIADITDVTIPIQILPQEILDKIYSNDGETIILVTFKTSTSDEATLQGIENLRNVVKQSSSVSGMSAMVLDTMNLSNKEVSIYIIIAVIFCIAVLAISTDSYLIPVLLLGNIGIAILYNMGTNVFLGEISYITKAISAVLQLGVTTDFSIFLYHKYEALRANKMDKKIAMEEAINATFRAVAGSSLTTIAGFLALCTMDLSLGKDIGIVMAKGVLCGVICVLTLFPALLIIFDNAILKTKHKLIFPKFKKIQEFSIKHYILTIIIFLILLIPAIYGNNNVKVYYKLDKSLPANLPSSIANSALAEKFNIVSPEIVLIDKNLKSNELNEITTKIKNMDGVNLVLAPSNIKEFGIPEEMLPEDLVSIFENDKYQLIIINSEYEVASNELNNQINEIDKIVKSYDENAIIAGEGALTNDLIKIADHDFKMVNYVSIAVIFIIMIFVLKSASLPVILVCMIEFAISVNMSISYYMGVTLPFIASIVIGTIQLGATIDYAILMSTKYLEERKKTHDKFEAMKETLAETVQSIITSALCFFAATFGVAVYSKIDMIGAICTLIARGSIISMLVVILILPSLLLIFDKIIMKTTVGMKNA